MTNSNSPLDDTGTFRAERRSAGIGRILDSIVDAGRGLLGRKLPPPREADAPAVALAKLCRQLFNHRGEASGLALADEILASYQTLPKDERLPFFKLLSEWFAPDPQAIAAAAEAYRDAPAFESLAALAKAVEAPRQKLLRRLNMAPGGTGKLVRLRGQLLENLRDNPELRPFDADLRHLLIAWFNRGFLVMERIDWNSPANVLEKIVTYEAVHEIDGLEDLRTRLADDRRCFAFFHPAMPDDPVIFVQVALTSGLAGAVGPLIASDREITNPRDSDTALFYSISNCHDGLRGISFGHFLIKQVIEELRHDLENIKQFVTLSPVPGLRNWIAAVPISDLPEHLRTDVTAARERLASPEGLAPDALPEPVRDTLMRLCAYYLVHERQGSESIDPVARFHLGNGAALEHINWGADLSPAGLERSAGIMVNYVYRLNEIEQNHEAYFAEERVVASAEVQKLASSRD